MARKPKKVVIDLDSVTEALSASFGTRRGTYLDEVGVDLKPIAGDLRLALKPLLCGVGLKDKTAICEFLSSMSRKEILLIELVGWLKQHDHFDDTSYDIAMKVLGYDAPGAIERKCSYQLEPEPILKEVSNRREKHWVQGGKKPVAVR